MTEDEKREALAAFIHEIWAGWMIYMFTYIVAGETDHIIDGGKVERWMRQMNTAYCDLPEEEKRSDREIADRLRKHLDELQRT